MILGVVLLFSILNTNIVQTFLGKQFSNYYSDKWGATVEIYSIKFNPFSFLTLKGVKVIDPGGNLVLHANTIRCTYRGFPVKNGLYLRTLYLKDTEFHFKPLPEGTNLSFIIDYFASDKPRDTVKKSFPIYVERFEMENVTFSLENKRRGKGESMLGKVNPRDMHFSSINSVMKNVSVIRDSINADIQHLSTKEKSGLNVKNIKIDATVSKNVIIARNATVETGDSRLFFNASLLYNGWPSMRDYVHNVYMDVKFEPGTYGNMNDAFYWARNFPESDVKARFHGEFKGTVSDFQTDLFHVFVGENTSLTINSYVKGLPNIKETVFNANLDLLSASIKDFNSLQFPQRWNIPIIPEQFPNFGNVVLNGDFQGAIHDFEAKAAIQTDLGNINALATLNQNKETDLAQYIVEVSTSLLNLKPLTHSDWAQSGQLHLEAKGEGLSFDKIKADIYADITNFNVKNYVYDSIIIAGQLKGKTFNGEININDPNLKITGQGFFGFQPQINGDLSIEINKANLLTLNLGVPENLLTGLSTNLKTEFSGENLNHIEGYVLLENTHLQRRDTEIVEDSIFLSLYKENEKDNLVLNSNFFDFSLYGDFPIDEVSLIKDQFINDFFPKYNPSKYKDVEDDITSEFVFNGMFKDFSKISFLYDEKFKIAENTSIWGDYSPDKSLTVHLSGDLVGFKGLTFDRWELSAQKIDSLYDITFQAPFIFLGNLTLMRNAAINLQCNNSIASLDIWWDDKTDTLSYGEIHARGAISPKNVSLQFLDSRMSVQGSPWQINRDHTIKYINGDFLINNLVIEGNNQKIEVNAELSTDAGNELIIGLQNFELNNFNFFTERQNILFQGTTSGDFIWNRLEKDSYFKIDFNTKDMMVNEELLGDVFIKSTWDNRNKRMGIELLSEIETSEGNYNPFKMNGYFYPSREKDNMDFDIHLKSFPLSSIHPFITSISSEVEGNIEGNLKLKGELANPVLLGKLKFDSGSILIDYLNTKYELNDTVHFAHNKIRLNHFLITDSLNNQAYINGEVTHSGFKDFQFNFNINSDNFLFLNTTSSSKEPYYGKVFASVDALLTGSPRNLDLNITAQTKKETSLTIPIDTKTNLETQRYIQFVSRKQDSLDESFMIGPLPKPQLGFNITINLVATPDAAVFLPMAFSQFTGEIRGTGNGSLKLGINSKEGFSIFGEYIISNGTFRMQLINLFSKDFKIEEGGTIQWAGSPLSGIIDIKAIYALKASLEPLFEDQNSTISFNDINQSYRKRVDVQSIVNLTGSLTDPTMSFDIQFPYLDAGTQEQAFAVLDRNNERIMMEQTVSLLFLGVFYSSSIAPTDVLIRDGVNTGINMLTSQVGSVISNITGLNIGLDYEGGDNIISDRWNVNISENIGKFYIEGRFGFGGTELQISEVQNASNFTGDVLVGCRFSNHWSLTAFNRSNVNDFTKSYYSPYTQGVGVTYRKDFNVLRELFSRSKKLKKQDTVSKKEEDITIESENDTETQE